MSYQYETSPRKYEPEYHARPKKKKAKTTKKVSNTKKSKKNEKLEKLKFKATLVFNIIVFLVVVFTISFRNALINQSFAEIQKLKTQVSEIQKENDQLEITIQNSLNLSTIEQTAKDLLGMQKLTNKQTVYLTLPKKDYVEPSTEEVVIEENTGIIQSIINYLKNIF